MRHSRLFLKPCLSTVAAVAVVALSLSCDEAPSTSPVRRISPDDARGKGAVRGKVRFLGTAPAMKVLKNEPCHEDAPRTTMEEPVIVGPDQGLKNVFVYLQGGPAVDGQSLPPAMLDQVNCQYVPHVIGVVVGQRLRVKSSDPAYHNTHYTPSKNASANFGLLRAGHEKDVQFTAAEIFPVRCDVHPWMSAYIGVFDNPFFATTGEDGSFTLSNLPAGDYTLVAWHEIYGELRQPISIAEGAPIEANFDYKPPG